MLNSGALVNTSFWHHRSLLWCLLKLNYWLLWCSVYSPLNYTLRAKSDKSSYQMLNIHHVCYHWGSSILHILRYPALAANRGHFQGTYENSPLIN